MTCLVIRDLNNEYNQDCAWHQSIVWYLFQDRQTSKSCRNHMRPRWAIVIDKIDDFTLIINIWLIHRYWEWLEITKKYIEKDSIWKDETPHLNWNKVQIVLLVSLPESVQSRHYDRPNETNRAGILAVQGKFDNRSLGKTSKIHSSQGKMTFFAKFFFFRV